MAKQRIPAKPSIRRLPSYLNIVRQANEEELEYISGTVIATELNLEPIQVRKDLAITGITGRPKRGYPVVELIAAIEHFLGWDKTVAAVLVGAGNLGTALSGYQAFKTHGLHITAAFDCDVAKIGTSIHEIPVLAMDSLGSYVQTHGITLAILTVPSPYAQKTADVLVTAGITAIWNFTNVKLKVPQQVIVQREDLTSGYAMLCIMNKTRNTTSMDSDDLSFFADCTD